MVGWVPKSLRIWSLTRMCCNLNHLPLPSAGRLLACSTLVAEGLQLVSRLVCKAIAVFAWVVLRRAFGAESANECPSKESKSTGHRYDLHSQLGTGMTSISTRIHPHAPLLLIALEGVRSVFTKVTSEVWSMRGRPGSQWCYFRAHE